MKLFKHMIGLFLKTEPPLTEQQEQYLKSVMGDGFAKFSKNEVEEIEKQIVDEFSDNMF